MFRGKIVAAIIKISAIVVYLMSAQVQAEPLANGASLSYDKKRGCMMCHRNSLAISDINSQAPKQRNQRNQQQVQPGNGKPSPVLKNKILRR